MAGIGLNPSKCCCNPIYTCAVRITAPPCGSFLYSGRMRISSATLGFSQTVDKNPSINRWDFLVPAAGSYLVESIDAPPARHDPISQTITAACGVTYTIFFPVASGYRCPSCAPLNPSAPVGSPVRPIPLTLTGTHSLFGSCVLTWDSVQGKYFGSKTVTFPAATVAVSGYDCPESIGTLDYTWFQIGGITSSCVFGVTGHRGTIPPTCPGDDSHGVNPNAGSFVGTRTDVPLFFTTTVTTSLKPGLYGDYSGSITFTLSE